MPRPTWTYRVARPAKFAIDELRRLGNRLMPGEGRLPDFFVIGAQKAATTSLYQYLIEHPDVRAALTKEVHYFDRHFRRGLPWFRSNFPSGPGGWITGEATPYYLFHPFVPERLRSVCPEARLIVLLRDPVRRAISHYEHERRRGFERLPLGAALDAEASRLEGAEARLEPAVGRCFAHEHYSYQARGHYAEQLERWLDVFPRHQLLVMKTESLHANQQHELDRVAAFLELDEWRVPERRRYHSVPYEPPDPGIVARLTEYFSRPNAALAELLGEEFQWHGADTALPTPAGPGSAESAEHR